MRQLSVASWGGALMGLWTLGRQRLRLGASGQTGCDTVSSPDLRRDTLSTQTRPKSTTLSAVHQVHSQPLAWDQNMFINKKHLFKSPLSSSGSFSIDWHSSQHQMLQITSQ